jgi:hypothetical protein
MRASGIRVALKMSHQPQVAQCVSFELPVSELASNLEPGFARRTCFGDSALCIKDIAQIPQQPALPTFALDATRERQSRFIVLPRCVGPPQRLVQRAEAVQNPAFQRRLFVARANVNAADR